MIVEEMKDGRYKVYWEIYWRDIPSGVQSRLLETMQKSGLTEAQTTAQLEKEQGWDHSSVGKVQLFNLEFPV